MRPLSGYLGSVKIQTLPFSVLENAPHKYCECRVVRGELVGVRTSIKLLLHRDVTRGILVELPPTHLLHHY